MNLTLSQIDGLWTLTTEPVADPSPEPYEQIVVELAGAIAVWPLGAAPGSWPVLTVTDLAEADWLWRWIGPDAHIAVHTAISSDQPGPVLVDRNTEQIALVQRLGLGHWLRLWWPTSPAGDIPALDRVLLALEVAVLTVRCDALLGDGWDSGADLLAEVAATDVARVVADTAGAAALVAELPDECVEHWTQSELDAVRAGTLPVARHDDFALAAGGGPTLADTGVASGRSSIDWAAVPAGIFDAAEGTLRWSVDLTQTVRVSLTTELLAGADPSGLTVWVWSPPGVEATGTLDEDGRAELYLPLEPAQAWTVQWSELIAGVGPRDASPRQDRRGARERIRALAWDRLAGAGTFLAEERAITEDW